MSATQKSTGSRDAARTRSALIEAARWLLTRVGYDQLGTRDIAARAGVDAALVQRYFGSKKRLFQEAIEGEFDAKPLLTDLPRRVIAERLAEVLLNPTKDRARFDATLVMLRSASSGEVRRVLAAALEREFLAPLAEAVGKGSRTRAVGALAVLAGFDLLHTILGIEVLDEPEGRRLLVKLLEACLNE